MRYAKQRIFLGLERDQALRQKKVAILGMGALGCATAPWLVRAGVGHLTVLDRDLVELSNLQRQLLFHESDLGRPKAEAAADLLKASNSEVRIQPIIADLTSSNARELLSGFDLLLDGTDNFEARYLINDFSILTGTPWIYAGVIGGEGMVWPLHPPKTPCLRCLLEEPPSHGDVDTCDSAGVLGPAVGVIGSWAALEAIKSLVGREPHSELVRFDFWHDQRLFLQPPIHRCRYCTQKITEFLDERWTVKASSLCGLEGVQIRVNGGSALDLQVLKTRLELRTGQSWCLSSGLLRGMEGDWKVSLFQDGRALIHGSVTPERARSWYAEVVGC